MICVLTPLVTHFCSIWALVEYKLAGLGVIYKGFGLKIEGFLVLFIVWNCKKEYYCSKNYSCLVADEYGKPIFCSKQSYKVSISAVLNGRFNK